MAVPARSGFVTAAGRRLEYDWHAGDARRPTLVFLHEGLGCAALWRDFPARVAAATGAPALVYSRYGYGRSAVREAPFRTDYMHREALDALPELLDGFGIERPILVGHSDGASIALIHAGSSGRAVAGLIVEAPHVFVEDRSIAGIEAARRMFETSDLRTRMAKYHADPEATFRGWNDAWLDPAFRAWNIEDALPGIACPVLAIQGTEDDYGTLRQIEAIEAGVTGRVDRLVLAGSGHAPHRERPSEVLAAMKAFVDGMA